MDMGVQAAASVGRWQVMAASLSGIPAFAALTIALDVLVKRLDNKAAA